jgi:hypothetical protein
MADNPALNRPQSGSYGEDTARANLAAGVSGNGAGPGPPPTGLPQPAPPPDVRPASVGAPDGRPGGTVTAVPGLPPMLQRPSERPAEPVWTPSQDPAMTSPETSTLTSMQQRLLILDALRSSPSVSPETREWAAIAIATLLDQPLPQQ